MGKNKVNINISQDDNSINDYLYCWSEMDEKPNKVTLYGTYNTELFTEFVTSISKKSCGNVTDRIPSKEEFIVNEKSLLKIEDSIFISFISFDKLTEEGFISDVNIYHSNSASERVEEILISIDEFEIDDEDIEDYTENRFFVINIGQTSLELNEIGTLDADYENIDLYFNEDVIKRSSKLSKKLSKNKKGLTIMHGERGTGKTTLVSHIVLNTEKKGIFIPCTMFESTINNPDFRNFIKKHKNSILIIDDSELYFSELYTKSNIFTNNILQLIDGFQSDELELNIIVILNVDSVDEIDHTLLDCNNILDIIEIKKLDKSKSNELSKFLGYKNKIKSETKLNNVLKKNFYKQDKIEIGFD